MPPPPDAQFRREFREALIDACPTLNDLKMLVEDTTGVPLQNVTLANGMPSVVALHHQGNDEHNIGVRAGAIRTDLAGRADAVLQQLVA
jgi:hypothetical protein